MQDLLHLLQELKVPAIEPAIVIVPVNKETALSEDPTYQLKLDLENDNY